MVFPPQQWPACDKSFLSYSVITSAAVPCNSLKYQLKHFKYFIERIAYTVHQPLHNSEPSRVFPYVKLGFNLLFISIWNLGLLEGKKKTKHS